MLLFSFAAHGIVTIEFKAAGCALLVPQWLSAYRWCVLADDEPARWGSSEEQVCAWGSVLTALVSN